MTARPLTAGLLAALLALPAAAQEDAEAVAASTPAPGAEAAAPAALPAITVSEVRTVRLADRVVASGLVDAVEEVQVQPLVEGQPVDELLADVGDLVEEGEVLARLSTSTLELELSQLAANRAAVEAQIAQSEASLVQARASAEEAARVAERALRLAEDGTVPQAQAEQATAADISARAAVGVAEQGVAAAQAQLETVEAQIANAELQLERAEVRAPVAGLVVERNARLGAVASAAGTPMFVVVRDNAMELRAEVSETDLLRLESGQPARMVAAEGAEPITGAVRLVEPSIDAQTRLGTARIAIDDPSRVVKGMFLQAEVVVEEADALAVPVSAVGAGEAGPVVMRVRDGVVEQVPVATGIRDGGLIAVTRGLSGGDLVVTRAAAFVRDGDRINPVMAESADAAPAQEN